MGVRSLNGLNGTDTSVVITNRMLATQPLEMTQPTFTDPITMSIKGLSGFGTNGQILETTGSQIQYRTAPIESNWINNNANLYPKDGVDENVLVGATTNPNSVKFYVSNGIAEINDTLKLTGTNQELQFVSNSQNKGIYFHTAAGTSAGWKMYGVSNQGGSARLEQLQNTQYMLELYGNDTSIDYYKFQRGTFDIRNQGSAVGQNSSAINFKDFNNSNTNKFRLDSNLDTKKFSLLYNSGSLDEDVMVFNCSTNTERQITFDKTLFYTINGDPSTTSDTIFKLSTNSNDITNGGNPIIQIQHKGLSGMSASWQLGDNGDVLFGGAGSATEKLKLYTSGGNIEFWGSQLGQTNQYGSINSTIADFLSTDTRIKRLKLRPNTHTTTIQENGSIAGDITLTLPSTTGTLATTDDVLAGVFNISGTTMTADPQANDSNITTQFTISSQAGSNGDCLLLIQADTDNSVETSNPRIQLQQDGGATNAFVELSNNDFQIGTTYGGSSTILYTNSGTLAISSDSGSTNNIATFSSTLADLKSTATKAVKLQTNTIEGTTTSTNTIVSQTDGWKITSQASNSTLILDNGNGSYTPYFSVDSSNSATVPIQILITNIGSAYVIGRDSGGTSQSNLQHFFYGEGIFTNSWSGINNTSNIITSNPSNGWEIQTNTTNQLSLKKSGVSYYPFLGTTSNSIPYNLTINGISGNVYEVHNTNNQILDISHRFFGKKVRVPKLVATYQTNNEIVSESSGWIINANTPQYALRIRRIPTGGNYDPNLGIKSDSVPFTISCGGLSEVYNISNTNNSTSGIQHIFKGQLQSNNGIYITGGATDINTTTFDIDATSTVSITASGTNEAWIENAYGQFKVFGSYIKMSGQSSNFYTWIQASNHTNYWDAGYGNSSSATEWRFRNASASYSTGYLYITSAGAKSTNFTSASSDDRLKINEELIENATGTIMKLRPQKYDKYDYLQSEMDNPTNEEDKNKVNNLTHEWGFIAQEVYYEVPELRKLVDVPLSAKLVDNHENMDFEDIRNDPDYSNWGDEKASLHYNSFIALLTKGFQEQQAEINTLKEEVNTYKSIIDKLLKAPSFKAFKESVA